MFADQLEDVHVIAKTSHVPVGRVRSTPNTYSYNVYMYLKDS